jgi:hypothetical protein
MAPNAKQEELEESLRRVLDELVPIAEALAKHCDSVDDLAGMARLALTNPSQLRILMQLITSPPQGKR